MAFAKCLCQDGVSNDDLRCLHSCLQATGVEYCFSDFCNAGAKAGTLFDQAVLGSCKNPTNEAASGGDSSGGGSSGGDSSGAAATSDAPAAATSEAATSSAVSSTVNPSSTAATASQAASPSSTLTSSSTSATPSPTKSGSEARRIKASKLGHLFLIIYIVG